jgi:hypothetical protein
MLVPYPKYEAPSPISHWSISPDVAKDEVIPLGMKSFANGPENDEILLIIEVYINLQTPKS